MINPEIRVHGTLPEVSLEPVGVNKVVGGHGPSGGVTRTIGMAGARLGAGRPVDLHWPGADARSWGC